MYKTIPEPIPVSREGLNFLKVFRFLSLPFCPSHLKTYMAVHRFEDIPIDDLIRDGVEGVLLDADGTLGAHHVTLYPDSVVRYVRLMMDKGLRVAIYTNSSMDRFQQFSDVDIVREAHPKPDRRGFEAAMKNYLQLNDPSKICMIGDNFITDGGANSAGMKFIYVHPVKGKEGFFHSKAREIGYLFARFYYGDLFKNSGGE